MVGNSISEHNGRDGSRPRPSVLSKDYFETAYFDLGLSFSDISTETGHPKKEVEIKFHEFGFSSRSREEGLQLVRRCKLTGDGARFRARAISELLKSDGIEWDKAGAHLAGKYKHPEATVLSALSKLSPYLLTPVKPYNSDRVVRLTIRESEFVEQCVSEYFKDVGKTKTLSQAAVELDLSLSGAKKAMGRADVAVPTKSVGAQLSHDFNPRPHVRTFRENVFRWFFTYHLLEQEEAPAALAARLKLPEDSMQTFVSHAGLNISGDMPAARPQAQDRRAQEATIWDSVHVVHHDCILEAALRDVYPARNAHQVARLWHSNPQTILNLLDQYNIAKLSQASSLAIKRRSKVREFKDKAILYWLREKNPQDEVAFRSLAAIVDCDAVWLRCLAHDLGFSTFPRLGTSPSVSDYSASERQSWEKAIVQRWLYDKYVVEELSINKISKMTSIEHAPVRRWLAKCGFRLRGLVEAIRLERLQRGPKKKEARRQLERKSTKRKQLEIFFVDSNEPRFPDMREVEASRATSDFEETGLLRKALDELKSHDRRLYRLLRMSVEFEFSNSEIAFLEGISENMVRETIDVARDFLSNRMRG